MLEEADAGRRIGARNRAPAANRVQPGRRCAANVPPGNAIVAGIGDVGNLAVRAEIDVVREVQLTDSVTGGKAVPQDDRRRRIRSAPRTSSADIEGLYLMVVVVGYPDAAVWTAGHVAWGRKAGDGGLG